MLDRYQRAIMRCSICGTEIGRGEYLGVSSAICAQCADEKFPQFKKDPPAPVPPRTEPQPLPEPFVTASPESKPNMVAISTYEGPAPKKKKATKKSGKAVSKVIKSLGRLK